ncbi:ABC transporter ATP-binding protein [Salimicrobium halophilum]|uniref:NitT/TauT family transport system ATP-binding protein n=1 Tax=Salimicrobium halophilum TaxID=86666 RepID=A0A1G8RJY8_9BACI|nr:ABC transporter ATP-binding protein [Salimicrobium halophilum]SDJ16690.1 NitT/TauT family transport system ATP-binding protein [Salimicrobium halophilum]
MKEKIVIEALTKAFYQKEKIHTAVEDITVSIRDGEFVCLVGPSGCGKTTLLRIIAGLIKESSGSYNIQREKKESPLQSMVFQEQGVIPWLTVRENVAFGLKMRGLDKRIVKERTDRFLEKVGLTAYARQYPKELSGGMKQRVSIARAFANDPEILLMDEPFGALDEQNKFILQEELLHIWAETKKTVLFITHSIDEALLLADRVLLMSAGPGSIVRDITVDIERPRTMEKVRADPRAAELFVEIWNHLQEEVQKGRKGNSS